MFIQDGTTHLHRQHGPIICTLLIAIVLDVRDDVQLVCTYKNQEKWGTMDKTELLHLKNMGVLVAMDFTKK